VSYTIAVKEKPEEKKGFVLLKRRRVVGRTFAWRGRYRRNRKDDERNTAPRAATIKISAIARMLGRLRPDGYKIKAPLNIRTKPAKWRKIFPDSLLVLLR